MISIERQEYNEHFEASNNVNSIVNNLEKDFIQEQTNDFPGFGRLANSDEPGSVVKNLDMQDKENSEFFDQNSASSGMNQDYFPKTSGHIKFTHSGMISLNL